MYGILFLLAPHRFRSYCITIQTRKILILLFFIPISLSAQNLDIQILRAINSPQDIHSDGFFRVISNSDVYVMCTVPATMAIIGFAIQDNKALRNACVVAGATVLNFAITTALKYSVNRDRPFVTYSDIVNKTGKLITDPSFPSGHTSTAFATATSVSLCYPKWFIIVPAYAYAGTVGYSRMRLGAHYPSDVISGAIIGSGCAYLTHIVNKKINYGKNNKKVCSRLY